MRVTYVIKFKDTALFRNEDDGKIFKIPLSDVVQLSAGLRPGCTGQIVQDQSRGCYRFIFEAETQAEDTEISSENNDLPQLEGDTGQV